MKRAALALALLLGCSDNGDPLRHPSPGGSPDLATRTWPGVEAGQPPCVGVSREVTFQARDGLVLHGTVTCATSEPKPAVVFAHQLCRDRREWSDPSHDWVSAFARRDVVTLAVDLRGHGASTLWPDGTRHDLCAGDATKLYAAMVDDVAAAIDYAHDSLLAQEVAVVGSAIGSNAAIVAYTTSVYAVMLVALSPSLDDRGIATSQPLQTIGPRGALLEAAEDDPVSADALRQLVRLNGGVQIQIWPTGGHGNEMIVAHPEELDRVADLVVRRF